MLDIGLVPINGGFDVLSEDEYDEVMIEAEEEELIEGHFVEISDDDTEEAEGMEASSVDEDNDGGQPVQMMMLGVNQDGMGQRGN